MNGEWVCGGRGLEEGEESKGLIGFREKVGLYETGQDKAKRRDLKVLKRRGYKPDIKLNVCQS